MHIGNLGYAVTGEGLQNMFAAHGTVESAQVITDRNSGLSKGFGFVEMSSTEEAQAATTGLNGTQHEGRALAVNEAKPRARSAGLGGVLRYY